SLGGQIAMHADYQNIFVVGAVEDTDHSARGRRSMHAPQEIVPQFLLGRCFETCYLATLWVDAGEDMPDGPVFPRCVESLQHNQQSVICLRVYQLLHLEKPLAVLVENGLSAGLAFQFSCVARVV